MRLPTFKYTTSPDMSGATSRPVLQTPVLRPQGVGQRNVSAYLRDPKSGQRDMGLEVAAAGAQGKVYAALTEGFLKLHNTLAAAEAQADATDAFQKFQTEITVAEYNAKGIPLGRQVEVWDGSKNKYVTVTEPTHQDLVPTYKEAIDGRAEFYSKQLPLAVRNQFRAQALQAGQAGLQRVLSLQYTKQIEWIKHKTYTSVRDAKTIEDVDKILSSQNAILAFSADDLNKIRNTKVREFLVNRVAVSMMDIELSNHPVLAEKQIKFLLRTGHHAPFVMDITSGEVVMALDYKYAEPVEGWNLITGDDKLKMLNALETIKTRMHARAVRQEDEAINGFHQGMMDAGGDNKNIPVDLRKYGSTWSDVINNYTFDDGTVIDIADRTTLLSALKSIREGVTTNHDRFAEIMDNLPEFANPAGRKTIMADTQLSIADKKLLRKQSYDLEIKGNRWFEKSNPFGFEGAQAIDELKAEFRIFESEGGKYFGNWKNDDERFNALTEFNALRRQLYDHVTQFTPATKPREALKWVRNKIKERNGVEPPPAATNGPSDNSSTAAVTTTPAPAPASASTPDVVNSDTNESDNENVVVTAEDKEAAASVVVPPIVDTSDLQPATRVILDSGLVIPAYEGQTKKQQRAYIDWITSDESRNDDGNVLMPALIADMPPGFYRETLIHFHKEIYGINIVLDPVKEAEKKEEIKKAKEKREAAILKGDIASSVYTRKKENSSSGLELFEMRPGEWNPWSYMAVKHYP